MFVAAEAEAVEPEVTDTLRYSFYVTFPINGSAVDSRFGANASEFEAWGELLQKCSEEGSGLRLCEVALTGFASPDGNMMSNISLADRRMRSLNEYLKSRFNLPDSVLVNHRAAIAWERFRDMVADNPDPRLMAIAASGSDSSEADVNHRLRQLRELDGGAVWRRLAREVFPQLRSAGVLTVTLQRERPRPVPVDGAIEGLSVATAPAEPIAPRLLPKPALPVGARTQCRGSWHGSTSLLGWSLAIANATAEYDFGCRWSAALSLYYSAWNYGSATRKFRTFIFRPQLRYWPGGGHNGLFLDLHAQMAAYNFALPGWEYRIQDVGGKHPALGGGIGAGYRLPLGRNGRWAVEAAVGAGVYHLKYDRFENRPNGPKVDTRSRTFFGIDNVAVSLVYIFK